MTVIPNLSSLSDQVFGEIQRAWLEHLVVLFRGQQLALEGV